MEHTFEANIDEQIEIDCELVSKVKDDFEAVVCSVDPKNSDQITVVEKEAPVTMETDDQVVVDYDDKVVSNAYDTQAVESQASEKSSLNNHSDKEVANLL